MRGFHAVVRPRGNPILGMRNALNMAIWSTRIEAIAFCMNVMVSHYESRLGMSDATIERFEGLVNSY
jgi:hypothetical protein